MSRVIVDPAAIARFGGSTEVKVLLGKIGEQVAQQAADAAPKRSGEGAASIRAEVDADSEGAVVRVSWDQDHFYMLFQEIGTRYQPARPFLRPAVTATRTL